jgi:hypothetical protein
MSYFGILVVSTQLGTCPIDSKLTAHPLLVTRPDPNRMPTIGWSALHSVTSVPQPARHHSIATFGSRSLQGRRLISPNRNAYRKSNDVFDRQQMADRFGYVPYLER